MDSSQTRATRPLATLHLICGLPCAGKTTLARQIEQERSALRLTPDEWITRLFGPDPSTETLDAARGDERQKGASSEARKKNCK